MLKVFEPDIRLGNYGAIRNGLTSFIFALRRLRPTDHVEPSAASLWNVFRAGFEPASLGLRGRCSTTELPERERRMKESNPSV